LWDDPHYRPAGVKMPLYQMKIVIQEYKLDEFVDSLRSLLPGFLKEKGCLDYSVYQDFDDERVFCIVAEWETHEAMQKHFLTHEFKVLIGAAKVLGETLEMIMAEVSESRDFELPAKIAVRKTTNSINQHPTNAYGLTLSNYCKINL
jgi:quinol monooxygenase YgiN